MSLNWSKYDAAPPGQTWYIAPDPEQPGHTYVATHRKEGTGLWKLTFRSRNDQALRVIYVGNAYKDCREYAETYRATEQQ